jgi:predicted alpha/beta hydrolase family esterase
MTNVFIIHGAYGNPDENWIPWLKGELEKLNYNVIVPKFPTPENQNLKNWLDVFSKYNNDKFLNSDTIFIGHSIGVAFLLNVLESKKMKKIKSAYFIAGFTGKLNNPKFDIINESFANKIFDWNAMKSNCNRIFVYHSDNDPYVPLAKAEDLAKNLNVKVNLVKNAGHFGTKAGYTKFELLLEKIKKEM